MFEKQTPDVLMRIPDAVEQKPAVIFRQAFNSEIYNNHKGV